IGVFASRSTDGTGAIAQSIGAKVFVEEWKGYAAQKNSAIDKASGDWILSLDADEELEPSLTEELAKFSSPVPADQSARLERLREMIYVYSRRTQNEMRAISSQHGNHEGLFVALTGLWIPRRNFFLGRWIGHGGYWPDPKLRLFRKDAANFEERSVH